MISEKQLAANRLNAQLSTGARTPDGHARSSLNNLRHGLTGQIAILPTEDREAHDRFCGELIDSFKPENPMERQLAQSVAEDNWRLNRARAIETNIFALGHEGERREIQVALADARTFKAEANQFQLLTIYEQRINRTMLRNLQQLKALQTERREQSERALEEAQLLAQQSGGASGWIESDKFDIVGKPEEGFVPQDQLRKMVQSMLAERFQLSIHHDEKELPIYVLSEAKGGSKMKARKPNDGGAGFRLVFDGPARLPGRNATVAQLIFVLQTRGVFDRPVVDKTGLTGNFDFDLSWSPIENQPGGRGAPIASDSDAPDLFSAIQQQLGLKLESRRGPVDVVVIDRVEKPLVN